MLAHASTPSTQVQGQPKLHNEILSPKMNNKNKNTPETIVVIQLPKFTTILTIFYSDFGFIHFSLFLIFVY
jgi:hypothetical protein